MGSPSRVAFSECPSCGAVLPVAFAAGAPSTETTCDECHKTFVARVPPPAKTFLGPRAWLAIALSLVGLAVAVGLTLSGSGDRPHDSVQGASPAAARPEAALPPVATSSAAPQPAPQPMAPIAPTAPIVSDTPTPSAAPVVPPPRAAPAPVVRRFVDVASSGPAAPRRRVEAAAAPAADTSPRPVFRALDGAFTTRVEHGEPIDRPQGFARRAKVGYHIRVRNTGEPRTITFEWTIGRDPFITQTLDVGTSWRWRTWAYGRAAGAIGDPIQVRVRDEDGNVLRTDRTVIGEDAP